MFDYCKKNSLILPFQVSNTATLAYFAHFEDELIISITLDNLNCPRQHEFLATAVVKQHKHEHSAAQWAWSTWKIIKIDLNIHAVQFLEEFGSQIQSIYCKLLQIYCKVVSSRPVYYSILETFGQRSQYISIKFPLHKQSENPWVCW